MRPSSTSSKLPPFTEGVPLPYQSVFSSRQLSRIVKGRIQRDMDDKWFIFYEEPYLFLYRGRQPVYRVKLKLSRRGAEVEEALWSKEMADTSQLDALFHGQLISVLISNLLLGQNKPGPTRSDMEAARQRHLQQASRTCAEASEQ